MKIIAQAALPITVQQFRDEHKLQHSQESDLIERKLLTAMDIVEKYVSEDLVRKTREFSTQLTRVRLPWGPDIEIISAQTGDPLANVEYDLADNVLYLPKSWDNYGRVKYTVRYDSGYQDLPIWANESILAIAGLLYFNRSPVNDSSVFHIPFSVRTILEQNRKHRV